MTINKDINPEIHFHSDLIQFFKNKKVDFKAWGSAGPDFYIGKFDLLGEVKKKESELNNAIKEIFDRQDDNRFSIKNFDRFFVATPYSIKVFKRINNNKNISQVNCFDLNSPIVFKSNELNAFFEYICTNFNKVKADNHLSEILDLLLKNNFGLNIKDVLTIILHLNDSFFITNKKLYFNPSENNEIEIELNNKESGQRIKEELLDKYCIENINNLREYIKYNYSSHLPDNKKSNLGKYYTPENLVLKVKELLSEYITSETLVMDLACGCGAFLDIFEDCHIIGRDIDQQAIDVLDILGFKNVSRDNSLYNVNREKYNLSKNDKVIIIGNPPYNDTTSLNKRFGTYVKNSKEGLPRMPIDGDIKSNDLGITFLKAYSKLNPQYICLLHPMAYLIKKSNFNKLKFFKDNYKLIKCIYFSSNEFRDLKEKKGAEFPICIALYEKGSMSLDYIQDFVFESIDSVNSFKLSSVKTIDSIVEGKPYVRKYPTKEKINNETLIKKSDIDLYMYNIRDINSLISSGAIMEYIPLNNLNYITVMFDDLHKYAYLNCMKNYFPNDYTFGNFSPIVNIHDLEDNIYIRDLFVITFILKNQKLSKLCLDNKNSIVYTKFLHNDYVFKSKSCDENKYNIYNAYLDFLKTKNINVLKSLENQIKNYFIDLKASMVNQS